MTIHLLWLMQFACSVAVAVLLSRRWWTWKTLAGLNALADVVEWQMSPDTHAYFYVWWAFRLTELLWMAFTTGHLMRSLYLRGEHSLYRFHWYPLMLSCLAVASAGRWETTSQMQILQAFILLACALPAWLHAFIFWNVERLPIVLSVLLAGEIACALYWRWVGYHAAGWFFAWMMGMALLLVVDHDERRHHPS